MTSTAEAVAIALDKYMNTWPSPAVVWQGEVLPALTLWRAENDPAFPTPVQMPCGHTAATPDEYEAHVECDVWGSVAATWEPPKVQGDG